MNNVFIINRALIAINAYIKAHKNVTIKNNKTILIVFQQIFGDSVVLQSSLQEYTKVFPVLEGYSIRFLVRPSVLTFMKNVLPLPESIEFETVDFKRFLEDYSYYKQIVKKYRGTASTLIVPGTSLSAEIFSAASDAKRKIGLIRSVDVTKPKVMAMFAKLAYTETVRPDKENMMLQRHRKLLNYLGITDYRAKLPNLLPKKRIIEERYAIISPGSSKMEKCWPTERFAEIADYITENYNLQIHLCGGTDEAAFETAILSKVKHPENIISHIGKTSFSDWSAIVQHAEIVVGNDSATMHLAAAGRAKAVCIAGVYDKYQFFPYKVDELSEGDRLPVTVYKDMSCEWCRTIGYFAGYGNAECKKRIENNQCAICIDKITVNEVKEAIDKLLKE